MTEQNQLRQTENHSGDPQGHTGGARYDAEKEINPYLYDNLASNLEAQISAWNRRADREADPETAQQFRWKAEGLGYALRLLYAFRPDFDDLVERTGVLKCQGCGREFEQDASRQDADLALCDACYELGHDEETCVTDNDAAL